MATLEERVEALEQENAELRQRIELHTIAIGGLINKAALEAINEKNDSIFKALTDHDQFTNLQLSEIREKVEVEIAGKIVGMQTEMRQRFTQLETTQREHTTRFDHIETLLTQIVARLPEKP